MDTEVWRRVVGGGGLTEVSSFGRVRDARTKKGLRQTSHRGYMRVRLWVSSPRRYRLRAIPWGQTRGADEGSDVRSSAFVHRLVAEAFFRPLGEGDVVNHKDANKQNNHRSNLEIVDTRANAAHAAALGLVRRGARRGEAHPKAVLTEERVREIKDSKETASSLALRFGCSVNVVCRVRRGEAWGHVA